MKNKTFEHSITSVIPFSIIPDGLIIAKTKEKC